MFKKIHVYDLDGVLVDSSHRYRNLPNGSIDLDYWIENSTPENIAKDRLLPLAKQATKDILNPEIYVIICTARVYCPDSIAFIHGYIGRPNKLMMRGENDARQDCIMKQAKLNGFFALRQFAKLPRFFWDDSLANIRHCATLFSRTFHIHSEIWK